MEIQRSVLYEQNKNFSPVARNARRQSLTQLQINHKQGTFNGDAKTQIVKKIKFDVSDDVVKPNIMIRNDEDNANVGIYKQQSAVSKENSPTRDKHGKLITSKGASKKNLQKVVKDERITSLTNLAHIVHGFKHQQRYRTAKRRRLDGYLSNIDNIKSRYMQDVYKTQINQKDLKLQAQTQKRKLSQRPPQVIQSTNININTSGEGNSNNNIQVTGPTENSKFERISRQSIAQGKMGAKFLPQATPVPAQLSSEIQLLRSQMNQQDLQSLYASNPQLLQYMNQSYQAGPGQPMVLIKENQNLYQYISDIKQFNRSINGSQLSNPTEHVANGSIDNRNKQNGNGNGMNPNYNNASFQNSYTHNSNIESAKENIESAKMTNANNSIQAQASSIVKDEPSPNQTNQATPMMASENVYQQVPINYNSNLPQAMSGGGDAQQMVPPVLPAHSQAYIIRHNAGASPPITYIYPQYVSQQQPNTSTQQMSQYDAIDQQNSTPVILGSKISNYQRIMAPPHPLRSTSPHIMNQSAAVSQVTNIGDRSQSNLTKLLQSNDSSQNFFSHNVSKRNLVSAYSNNSAKVITAFGMNSIIKRAKQIRFERTNNDIYSYDSYPHQPPASKNYDNAPITSASLNQIQPIANTNYATLRSKSKHRNRDQLNLFMQGSHQLWNEGSKNELGELGEYMAERQLRSHRRIVEQTKESSKRFYTRPRTGGQLSNSRSNSKGKKRSKSANKFQYSHAQDKELTAKRLIDKSRAASPSNYKEAKKPRPQTQVSPKAKLDQPREESHLNIIAPSHLEGSNDETYLSNKTNEIDQMLQNIIKKQKRLKRYQQSQTLFPSKIREENIIKNHRLQSGLKMLSAYGQYEKLIEDSKRQIKECQVDPIIVSVAQNQILSDNITKRNKMAIKKQQKQKIQIIENFFENSRKCGKGQSGLDAREQIKELKKNIGPVINPTITDYLCEYSDQRIQDMFQKIIINNSSKQRLEEFLQNQIDDIKSSFTAKTLQQQMQDQDTLSKVKDCHSAGYEGASDILALGSVEGARPSGRGQSQVASAALIQQNKTVKEQETPFGVTTDVTNEREQPRETNATPTLPQETPEPVHDIPILKSQSGQVAQQAQQHKNAQPVPQVPVLLQQHQRKEEKGTEMLKAMQQPVLQSQQHPSHAQQQYEQYISAKEHKSKASFKNPPELDNRDLEHLTRQKLDEQKNQLRIEENQMEEYIDKQEESEKEEPMMEQQEEQAELRYITNQEIDQLEHCDQQFSLKKRKPQQPAQPEPEVNEAILMDEPGDIYNKQVDDDNQQLETQLEDLRKVNRHRQGASHSQIVDRVISASSQGKSRRSSRSGAMQKQQPPAVVSMPAPAQPQPEVTADILNCEVNDKSEKLSILPDQQSIIKVKDSAVDQKSIQSKNKSEGQQKVSFQEDLAAPPQKQYDEELIKKALHNYEVCNQLQNNSATVEQVEASGTGIEDWAQWQQQEPVEQINCQQDVKPQGQKRERPKERYGRQQRPQAAHSRSKDKAQRDRDERTHPKYFDKKQIIRLEQYNLKDQESMKRQVKLELDNIYSLALEECITPKKQ